MSIRINNPGLQTTIQSAPRSGWRHQGVPLSGAADPLSHALANRLLDNTLLQSALEVTLSGVSFRVTRSVALAVTGAMAACRINGSEFEQHSIVNTQAGDEIEIDAPTLGARTYVAFRGGLQAQSFLGSESTYVPAQFGGHKGRPLKSGDELELCAPEAMPERRSADSYQLVMRSSWTLRATHSAETDQLTNPDDLFARPFVVSDRLDRMGIRLNGDAMTLQSTEKMQSAAVFPGIVQCPEDGRPYLLGVDAQTTGGYPRIAKVARLDLHMLGQLRPGDTVNFLIRDAETSADELHKKQAYWLPWLGDIAGVI